MRKELSQAEIWDDSALVQSWDDALAEYKATGDDLEAAVAALQASAKAESTVEDVPDTASMEDGEVAEDIELPNGGPATAAVSLPAEESLKDLLMSWYWAGYYTGLYQGQQTAAP